jgi:hypothetical protein
MRLIAFTVWGNDPKYLLGATKNAILAKEIYPGWICRFYVSQETPYPWKYNLKKLHNVEVVEVPKIGDWTFSFNRFLAMSEDEVEVVVSRDTDSRLTLREKAAVDEWLASDKNFHIMKDHPWHYTYPILAGMFGCKRGTIKNISADIDSFKKTDWYHSDQEFLKQVIYPQIQNNIMIHDDFNQRPFPTKRIGYEFIGQVFDEYDNTIMEHVEILKTKLIKDKI